MEKKIDLSDVYLMVGERIDNWIAERLTFENGCKRNWHEDDSFEEDEVSWVFTQKGQRLYDSYVRRAEKLINKKYPDEVKEDLHRYTGVIFS